MLIESAYLKKQLRQMMVHVDERSIRRRATRTARARGIG